MQHYAGSYRNEVSSTNNLSQSYENGNTKFSLKENVEEAKNIKRDIIIVDNTEDIGYGSANGFYKNDKIVLSLDNQAGMMSVYLGHELFHDIKVNSPELANQLQDFIIERLQQDKSYDLEMRVAENSEQYGFEGDEAREQALEEYHKEKLLINKQMLKAGIDEFPNLHGLIEAINKKTSSSQYLADL